MNNNYQVYQIAREQNPIPREDNDESINKAWYSIDGLGECLFKAATTTPGSLTEYRTDWSEKVVERLANILGLPVAQYEFATAYLNGSPDPIEGVISVDCIPADADISSGGFFLRQTFDDKLSRRYTIENILNALNIRSVKPPRNWKQQIPEIDTAAKLFIGYLMLDALIQNEDRNGSNWAVMSIEGKLELTSSFDHGVSLGSRNSDEDKLFRSVSEYTNESSFSPFKQTEGVGTVSVFNIFRDAVKLEPVTARIWLDKLAAIDSDKIDEIFKLIPEQRITATAATFAKLLLLENLKKIRLELAEISASIDRGLSEVPEIENPPNSPEPPNDFPEPPPNPRNPPKPPTPPNSPDTLNSPEPTTPADSLPIIPISTNDNKSPGNINMSIKLIDYDLINRRPQTKLSTGAIKTELREGTAIEQLLKRQGLIKEGERPTFYVAPYSKYINVDDLTNQAPEGTVLLATSSAQLYFGSPEVKAAIKTLMPLETQIPGYARGLFAKGQAQSLDRPLKVLVVDHETGQNNYGIPEIAIRNIAADGASIIDRFVGEQMKLIEDVGLSQVRGYSLDPQIGSYYIKGTLTPLNLQQYFATHGVDVEVDLVLTTSMLKGLGGGKLPPEVGIHEVEPADLFITRTQQLFQTTAKLGSVQDLYALGLAKDVSIPVQTAIQDLQQKQVDLISLAEDYVRTFKISQQEEVRKGKPEIELPGNIAFIDTILESKNWGLLELPSVRANLQEYVDGQIKNIREGAINELRGEFRPIVVCGELKHNQIAGSGLTTGDKHVALRFPVLNRGQVQAVTVNNDISFFLNPELEGIIPDAIYVGRQTLAEIEQDDPQTYQQIIEEFGSIEAARASWRTNLEAMKADFDGDHLAIFAERDYPNFYQEVVDNLTPEKLMHFVSKDKKQLIQSEDLPEMVVERLKDYVGIINSNLSRINKLYSSLDFIIAGTEGDLKSTEKLQAETLQLIYDSFQKYRDTAESLVEPDVTLNLNIPAELQATFDRFAPFYSVDFIKLQVDNPRAQSNYLYTVKDSVSMVLGAYKKKSLNATPINAKKGIVFPPDLIKDMEQMKFMKLKSIREGGANPALLVEYLDNYAKIHAQLSKIIDLSQPLVSNLKSIDPRTNEEIIFTTHLKVTPNHTYDPSQIDKYLRDYQTIVLRKCIEVVDKENQRSVDFVKSGVKPNEGIVYAVTDKLPVLDASIQLLKRLIVEENHQNRLPPSSSMTLNALIGQLRSVAVEPEMKAVVANFRNDYQNLQSIITLETQALKDFKYGKPIVLNVYTTNGSKIVVGNCNVSEINIFRQLEGKGSIAISDGLITFHPDNLTNFEGIKYEYVLGATAKTSAQIEGKQPIGDFEFEVLHDRIDELKAESRAVLAEFRNVIEQRGWNKQEVFAATAQLVGEKAISQDFLLSCLPDTLNEFVFDRGAQNIILDTEYASYLTKPTEYFVTTGENDTKNLRALVEVDGKQQWIEAGRLTGYGIQLLDKTSFQGTIEPNYNTITFKSPLEAGTQRSVLVGKLTSEGKNLIDRGQVRDLRIVRTQTPSYRLLVPSEQLDIQVSNLAPEIIALLGDSKSTQLKLDRLKIFDNKFSGTMVINDRTYYLSGVNFDRLDKKNRDNVTVSIRKEQFESISVEMVKETELEATIEVYSSATKIGEITQPAEQKFWGNRINELADAKEISIKVQNTIPKQVGYKVSIEENTLYNSNVWADVEPARTYQRGKDEVQSPHLTERERKGNEFKSERFKTVLEDASRNLRRQADHNSFPQSFSVKVTVPVIEESGLKEVEQLQLVVPDNKIKRIEAYFNTSQINIKFTKLERGIPETYEESRRGYTVLRVDPDLLTAANKTAISKQLGKPVSQADYQAKLAEIPITRQWTSIKLNNLKQWIERYPQSTNAPILDLNRAQPVPYSLKPITGEVLTRFKGTATIVDNSIVFEFINDRQRDTAAYHLGLPIKAELPSEDGKSTRYFAVVETATLQTYLNDRALSHVLVKDGVKRSNPILNSYSTSKDWTKLQSRAQTDIIMGFAANKYIGIPLEARSRTSMYRDNWGNNANTTAYKSTDVVMVSGNRTGKDTSNELLVRHFRTQYLPLIDAAIAGKAKILVGADAGIDTMVREHLNDVGYNLHLNSAGIYEATIRSQIQDEASLQAYIPVQEQTEREEECEYADMTI